MVRTKDQSKGKEDAEILVKTSCLVNTYRFIEKGPEQTKSEGKKGEEKKIGTGLGFGK
jgi:hypothetical protein